MYFTAAKRGCFLSRISFLALKKIATAMIPASAGVTIQLPTMPNILPHATASALTPTAVKPTMAPTIE